ncbi:P2Y purinoceptor 1 [Bombina bombina]|uniref:P2Y purinoceptor 1 n=1 Tax=Bombina bombina TaxID=8345 RepID=UPI00235B2270|nr:P2Y purinoceptor 1 [Bombina bombina]XP_053575903.1 P2Y purinoceptor 1 [Bombina bombina]XP_053575909.1 P2Y purinoceptor 1 [Bombina bombina]
MEEETAILTHGNGSVKCEVNFEFTFYFLSSVYLLVFIIGLIANVFGLWNLCLNWKNWSSLNVFVLNLGIADLLYVITLPFFVSYYHREETWMFGFGFCRLTRCVFHINMYASISFLTCISVQRYLGIVHPMKMMGRFRNLRYSFIISFLVWIWVLLQVLPNLLFMNTDRNATHCHDSTGNENLEIYKLYTIIITISGFFIPFLIIVVCYTRVLAVLKRNNNVDSSLIQRSMRLVCIIMILFFVCFCPFYVLRNVNLLSRSWQLQGTCTQTLKSLYISYQVTRGLASLNSAINPLVYLVTNENFVSKFRTMRRKSLHTLASLKKFTTRGDSRQQSISVSKDQEEEDHTEESKE